jgi:hypothetical protein
LVEAEAQEGESVNNKKLDSFEEAVQQVIENLTVAAEKMRTDAGLAKTPKDAAFFNAQADELQRRLEMVKRSQSEKKP